MSNDTHSEVAKRGDARLYVPSPAGWQAHVKQGWEKEYCYYQYPGEDYFHLLVSGEVYLQHGDEKCCLNCAIRREYVSPDRLHWQHGGTRKSVERL